MRNRVFLASSSPLMLTHQLYFCVTKCMTSGKSEFSRIHLKHIIWTCAVFPSAIIWIVLFIWFHHHIFQSSFSWQVCNLMIIGYVHYIVNSWVLYMWFTYLKIFTVSVLLSNPHKWKTIHYPHRKEGNVLFNNALSMFYLWLYCVIHSTCYSLCYTSHGALVGMKNSPMGPSWRIDLMTHRTRKGKFIYNADTLH